MAFFRGPSVVLDGLVLYLDATNPDSYSGTGSTWLDVSGNANNGTLTNGPTFDSGNKGSISFDGVDDFVIATNTTILQPPSAITLEATFQRDGGRTIINYGANSGGASKIYCFEQSSNISAFQAKVTTTNNPNVTLNGPILSTGTWYHVVMTYNGSTAILYINGLFYTSALASGNINYPANSNLNLGRKNTADGEYISGKIAFNRIYNRALSPQEILQNFNATKSRFGI
jgi:hypothetical protein